MSPTTNSEKLLAGLTQEEAAFIANLQAASDHPLSEQEINLSLEEARALGELPAPEGNG